MTAIRPGAGAIKGETSRLGVNVIAPGMARVGPSTMGAAPRGGSGRSGTGAATWPPGPSVIGMKRGVPPAMANTGRCGGLGSVGVSTRA